MTSQGAFRLLPVSPSLEEHIESVEHTGSLPTLFINKLLLLHPLTTS